MSKFNLRHDAKKEVSGEDDDFDYELSDNVVDDLIAYTRSRTVKNEQQFVLTTLGYVTGFMKSGKHYVSGVLIGTAGSGKSHLQNTVDELLPDEYLYQATSGSEKSIIYDDTWEDAYIASLDELQKPSDEIIEILKSLHGGEDEEFRYKVTGDGEGADRQVDEIIRTAIPYWFLYAQYDPDFEMWDRILKIPVHESSEKNDGVARTHWGHSFISFGGSDIEYMYDFEDGRKALQAHFRSLPKDSWVKIPAGEGEFGDMSFYDAVKDIFDIDRSETNRVAKMVANLVRASALLNHKNRETKTIQVHNEGYIDAIIAEPQDLANVMACRDVLMATTHQLDRKRRAICLAIEEVGGTQNAAPIKHPDDSAGQPRSIMGYLRETNSSFVKKTQIEQMLADLEDNGLVEKMERAGENGRHLYKFTSWQNLGKFNISDAFKELFDGTIDPFTHDEFIETARRLNNELTPKASDFLHTEDVSSGGNATEAQVTLGETKDGRIVDLAPHEETVLEMLRDTVHDAIIENLDQHDPTPRELIGIVPLGEDDDSVPVRGTVLDPEHEVWAYGPDGWVETPQDTEREIEKALRKLSSLGLFKTRTLTSEGGEPLSVTVTVEAPPKKVN